MTLSIRSPEADRLARQLADIEKTTITEAVVIALKDAVRARKPRVDPIELAKTILARRGVVIQPGQPPVSQSAYHDLDHDLTGDND
ncbi:MAG: type II toxin-antitoxin system VapB family antitoxin [Pseudomonadota bacterium]